MYKRQVKNNLTIARREWEGDSGEKSFHKTTIKDTGQNQGGGWWWGREVGLAGVG